MKNEKYYQVIATINCSYNKEENDIKNLKELENEFKEAIYKIEYDDEKIKLNENKNYIEIESIIGNYIFTNKILNDFIWEQIDEIRKTLENYNFEHIIIDINIS